VAGARAATLHSMTARYALADIAALVGEPTRAAILLALLDGRALPAGELAGEARLSAAATSLHLAKLTQGGLLAVRQEGRHRYYRLANEDVAHALEALGVIATPRPPVCPLSPERAALRAARTCYDHLAGAVAVSLAEMLEREGILRPESDRVYGVTCAGAAWFADAMGIDLDALGASRRVLARRCLDWTERRPHLAGALGAAVLQQMLALRWASRLGSSRALRITPRGRDALAKLGLREPLVA
jgi:DNA-binding transcriptional ArsR family regulator